MSAFKEAVQAMKDKGGWRSEGRPEDPCPKCAQCGYVHHETIRNKTTGHCDICSHTWQVPAQSGQA